MDPQVAWNELLDAIAANNLEMAEVYADGLLEWTSRKGFPPQTASRLLSESWDRAICRFVCLKVIAAAKPPWD